VRFEVKYPAAEAHEVELSGTVAVLGRDPSCDLVLNDARCSRRHAVVEAGPQGISIRDAGSANGIYVNGKKVERSALASGDVVRLGEVSLRVLPEEVPGTVVMAPEDLESMEAMHQPVNGERTSSVPPTPAADPPAAPTPAHAQAALPRVPHPPAPPPAPASPPVPAPLAAAPALSAPRFPAPVPVSTPPATRTGPQARASSPSGGPVPRPMTVTLLAILWMAGVLYYPLVTILVLRRTSGFAAYAIGSLGVLATLVSGPMAWGMWSRQVWTRFAQIALAILGLLTCVFTPTSAAILAYMFRGDVASHFSARRPDGPGAGEDGRLEPYYAAAIGLLAGAPALLTLILPFFLPAPAGL
jgi:hypothetical protein